MIPYITTSGILNLQERKVHSRAAISPQSEISFIVLDPNGEYSGTFGDNARVFKVDSEKNPLKVPLWFWNSAEWCSFTHASAKAQVPLIKRALRSMRNEQFDLHVGFDRGRNEFKYMRSYICCWHFHDYAVINIRT